VVDAKAPLDAYLRAIEAPDDEARVAALRDHARQVRDHMTRLAAKSYFERLQPAPEFVVMFLPGEAFFAAALQHDPGLIEFGVAQRVIPASPTTLIALLRAAYYGWRQERVAENAQAVSELGRELHERIAKLAVHLGLVGGALGRAVESYNAAMGSLESRVLVSARRFETLGAAKEGVTIDAPALQQGVVRQLAVPDDAGERA
jgi:DNA recombination protein RmuC